MRVTQSADEYILVLSAAEYESLRDACALLILVSGEIPGFKLQPETSLILRCLLMHSSGQELM